MRDTDAMQLINNRDFELIQVTFLKHPCKVNLPQYLQDMTTTKLKCSKYRDYNVAYFEEVVIHYTIESRVA